jgi:hypothetical protein
MKGAIAAFFIPGLAMALVLGRKFRRKDINHRT